LSIVILDKDFSVSGDALETFTAIFNAPRKPRSKANVDLNEYLKNNAASIHQVFKNLKLKFNTQGEDDEQANYFMLREIMKLEYAVINEHRVLLDCFSNDADTLKSTFSMLDVENAGV